MTILDQRIKIDATNRKIDKEEIFQFNHNVIQCVLHQMS